MLKLSVTVSLLEMRDSRNRAPLLRRIAAQVEREFKGALLDRGKK